MNRKIIAIFIVGFSLLLSGCGARQLFGSTTTPIPTITPTHAITPTTTPTPEIHTKVDVGGYSLRIDCSGAGSPTVVIDSGLGDPGDRSWTAIVPNIQVHTRICTYERAGLGQSDPPLKTPRTSLDMAKDLHTLLVNAHVDGPYVLVGHSIAGFHIRVYAGQYPQEVVGMVMVDCSHPDQESRLLALLPPETADESSGLQSLRNSEAWNNPHGNVESMDFVASAAQARAVTSLHDIPLVVLSANIQELDQLGIPASLAQSLADDSNAMQNELAELSSNSTHIIAEKSRHYIQFDQPTLVIDAILKVVDLARKHSQ